MVVLDYMPLKLVEGKGFLNLMSILGQYSQNICTVWAHILSHMITRQ